MRNGFYEVRIFSCWKNIMGSEYYSQVKPVKLKNKTLQVIVQNSAVATDIAFKSPIIIEKINQFFGYRAVEKITTIQKRFDTSLFEIKELNKPDSSCFVRAEARCSKVKDTKIRQALINLTAFMEKEAFDGIEEN